MYWSVKCWLKIIIKTKTQFFKKWVSVLSYTIIKSESFFKSESFKNMFLQRATVKAIELDIK